MAELAQSWYLRKRAESRILVMELSGVEPEKKISATEMLMTIGVPPSNKEPVNWP